MLINVNTSSLTGKLEPMVHEKGAADSTSVAELYNLWLMARLQKGGRSAPFASLQVSNAVFLDQGMTCTYTGNNSGSSISFCPVVRLVDGVE